MSERRLPLLLLCLAACSRPGQERAYASEVRAAHHQADAAQGSVQKTAAKDALAAAFEHGEGSTGAQLALRQDLADRTARLELELGHAEAALRWARQGQALSAAPSVLSANLLITEADALAAQGRRDEARNALLSALEINQALLRVELDNP